MRISQYVHRLWDQSAGLPQNSVNDLSASQEGFLWIATQEGPVRFDGKSFVSYNHTRLPELNDLILSCIFQDKTGRIWMGTDKGVQAMVNGQIQKMAVEAEIGAVSVLDINEDPDGTLWFSTWQKGLFCLRAGEGRYYAEADGLISRVGSSYRDPAGVLWVGTRNGVFRQQGDRFQQVGLENGVSESIIAFATDQDGLLWVGGTKGLFYHKDGVFRPYVFEKYPDLKVLALLYDSSNNLWIGTNQNLVLRLDIDGRLDSYSADQGFSGGRVLSLMEDQEKNIWVGTENAGLHQFSTAMVTSWTTDEGLANDVVSTVSVDSLGRVWVASNSPLLSLYENGKFERVNPGEMPGEAAIRGFFVDYRDDQWFCTDGGGLVSISKGQTRIYTQEDGLPGSRTASMYLDQDGIFWVCTDQGLAWLDGNRFKVITTKDGLSSNMVSAVFKDSTGILWIANAHGLDMMRGTRITPTEIRDQVTAIVEDSQKRVWFATGAHGLILWELNNFRRFHFEKNPLEDRIHDLALDLNENLWMTTNHGILQVASADLGRNEYPAFQQFGVNEGMKIAECNGGVNPSIARTPDGQMWFPTMGGVVMVDPNRPRIDLPAPKIHIESVFVDGQQWPIDLRLELPPAAERLEIHFSAPTFASPESAGYRFRLKEHDRDWRESNLPVAWYTNLEPGHYTFQLYASNGRGQWQEEPQELRFLMKAHYYQTIWFKILVGLCLIGIGLVLHRLQMRRIASKERRLELMVKQRTARLEEANARLLDAQNEVVAAAHRAGMVEIATNVLHLIGDSVHKVTRGSDSVGRILEEADLYKDLENYISPIVETESAENWFQADPHRAKAFMDKVFKLPEFAQILDRLSNEIRHHMTHMTKTVRAQQEYARVQGQDTAVDIPDTIADALRLRHKLLGDFEIEVRQEYEPLPSFKGRKNKLLRTLVAIIQNGCEAMIQQPDGKRVLTIRCRPEKDNILIDIHDTGPGIPTADLNQIFVHGFSTRPGHNGFGLHSCANNMTEMGGKIMVDTGDGRSGTLFRLELPVNFESELGT